MEPFKKLIRASREIKKEKRFSYRKKYTEEFVWGTSLLWLRALLSMSFFAAFFVYCFHLPEWRTCRTAPIKMHNIAKAVILCDERLNTSWLASLRRQCYFRLCFSFSCSGYDLTLTMIAQFTVKTTNSEKAIHFCC